MKRVLTILLSGVLCLTGCGGIVLTEKEQGMIAEYAASALLQYSASYQGKYKAQLREEETSLIETESSIEPSTGSDEYVTEQSSSGDIAEEIEETVTDVEQKSLAAAMGLEGFEVTYTGYEIASTYPGDGETAFVMKSNGGQMLLILKFQIMNTESDEKLCDILSNQLGFHLRVNDEKRLNVQLTMLLNDLYVYRDNILPGESRETVLVFQIPEDEAGEIHTLDLSIQYNGATSLYSLEDREPS